MRVTALLPGCLQRTQGFQVPMDRIQSVRDYIFYTNEGYVMQSQRSKLALHNADFSPLQWTWADCCFRLCWSSGPEPESTPWTRKRTRWTMVRRLIDWFNYPVNAQTAKCLHRGERHRGHVFSFVLFPSSFYPLGLKHELAANCASERILSQDVIGFVDYVLVPSVNGEQENRVQKGNGYFQVPPHTPVIFGEAGGRTLFR